MPYIGPLSALYRRCIIALMINDREASWPEISAWIDSIFGSHHQLTDIRPTASDLHYLKAHGKFYPAPGRHGHQQMSPKKCFKNCTDKLWEPPTGKLRYVQGLVASKIGIVFPHAWVTDAEGNTIELTWDLEKHNDDRYFGVPFTLKQLAKLQLHYGKYDWYEGFAAVLSEELKAS